MPQEEDLLDFETPIILSKYEKFLNYQATKPSYLKVLGIILWSILSGSIIIYKAGKLDNFALFSSIIVIGGGWFILLMTTGFFLHILLIIGAAFVDAITNYNPKIRKLDMLSVTFLLSLFSLITLFILAQFLD